MESFYRQEELRTLGLRALGDNVLISRYARIYSPASITIGSNVRIDDFCILSGKIEIGSHVHIAAYCGLFGSSGIRMDDFSGLSSRVTIYTASDDYSGASLTNPTVPDSYKKVECGPVNLGRHVIVGAGAIILPDVTLEEGVAVGALSLVTKSIPAWSICSGVPAKRLRERSRDLLALERDLLSAKG